MTKRLTSLFTDGAVQESHPKFNPRPGRGLNTGPAEWQSEMTNLHTPRHES